MILFCIESFFHTLDHYHRAHSNIFCTFHLCIKFFYGCNLPQTEPNKSDIFAGSVQERGEALNVDVNANLTRATSTTPSLAFTSQFRNASLHVTDIIRPSDVLTLSVWKNTDSGPLKRAATNSAKLDAVQVDAYGTY